MAGNFKYIEISLVRLVQEILVKEITPFLFLLIFFI